MPGLRVAINPVTETEIRCAYALAGHPGVGDIGLVGKVPPASWQDRIRMVDDGAGFDVVVSGRHNGSRSVLAGEPDHTTNATFGASLAGLARTLLTRVTDGVAVVALPGTPAREGRMVRLPVPVGDIRISSDHLGVPMGWCAPPWAAAAAVSITQTVAVVDEHRFLSAAVLAAAVILGGGGAVWNQPSEFLAACEEFGLVVAQADQPG